MPSVIDHASSGRAKCRACGEAIAKGELRFGEALPNAYGEGESLFWFHLPCAACARPESFVPVLSECTHEVADRGALEELARAGIAEPRLVRILKAERASSGRAKCRHCREAIAQGGWRLALQIFEEGRFNPIGTIHAGCAVGYFNVEPPLSRLKLPSNALSEAELGEVVSEIKRGAEKSLALPGLAKTAAPEAEPEAEVAQKSS
ncbi:MAG TPA: hypothetical protein VHV51_14765 [Polyangiaceae bacterium]|jgi:ribosomal protein L37AE/L43A|nr:hypothetical protein [Polyangiaceae bacterium]